MWEGGDAGEHPADFVAIWEALCEQRPPPPLPPRRAPRAPESLASKLQ